MTCYGGLRREPMGLRSWLARVVPCMSLPHRRPFGGRLLLRATLHGLSPQCGDLQRGGLNRTLPESGGTLTAFPTLRWSRPSLRLGGGLRGGWPLPLLASLHRRCDLPDDGNRAVESIPTDHHARIFRLEGRFDSWENLLGRSSMGQICTN